MPTSGDLRKGEKLNQIKQEAIEQQEYFTKIRRHLHKNPELGHQEIETSALIKKELESYGFEIGTNTAPTGVVGLLRGKLPGSEQVTAIRADIDALPILEKSGVEHHSRVDGVMHACGHDGNTAMLLAAAKLLSDHTDDFSGAVKLIFQPAEEVLNGARSMIDAGALENPKVDSIVALHGWPHLPTGVLGTWEGAYFASGDQFEIRIKGSGGHGAYPHRAKDALLAASHVVMGLQAITSRQLNAIDNTVLSICTIHGGTAFNIIPETIELTGTVRCHNNEIREGMPDRMKKIIKGILEAYDCDFEFTYTKGVSPVVNNPDTVRAMADAARKVNGDEFVSTLPGPVMGSEDFSEYNALVADSAILRIGITPEGSEEISLHNERFDFNDDAIPYGAAILAQYILDKNQPS